MSASWPTFELLHTGVPNLDLVLGGGLRPGALAMLMGPPGEREDDPGRANGLRGGAARASSAHPDGRQAPPIILITATGAAAAETLGADAVLHKPFELDDVAA